MSNYAVDYREVTDKINAMIADALSLSGESRDMKYGVLYAEIRKLSIYVLKKDYSYRLPPSLSIDQIADEYSNYVLCRIFFGTLPKVRTWYNYVKSTIRRSIDYKSYKDPYRSAAHIDVDDVEGEAAHKSLHESLSIDHFSDVLLAGVSKYKHTALYPLVLCKIRFPEISLSSLDVSLVPINLDIMNWYQLKFSSAQASRIFSLLDKVRTDSVAVWYVMVKFMIYRRVFHESMLPVFLSSPGSFMEMLKLIDDRVLVKEFVNALMQVYYYYYRYILDEDGENSNFDRADCDKWDRERADFFHFLCSVDDFELTNLERWIIDRIDQETVDRRIRNEFRVGELSGEIIDELKSKVALMEVNDLVRLYKKIS